MDDRGVARQTGAVAFLCSHHNTVHFSTVKVVPGARGDVGVALVRVALKPRRYGNICFSTISGPPADRASVNFTLFIGCHIARDTWSWRQREAVN